MGTSLIGNYTDSQAAQVALDALFVSVCSATGAPDMANAMLETTFVWAKPNLAGKLDADDTNATDATAETIILPYVPRRAKLVGCWYTSSTATGLTQAASNNATLTVTVRPGLTGVTSTLTLATATTTLVTSGGTGNWAQWTPVNIPVNAFDPTNTPIAQGGMVSVAITKNSSGVVVPGGRLAIRLQYV